MRTDSYVHCYKNTNREWYRKCVVEEACSWILKLIFNDNHEHGYLFILRLHEETFHLHFCLEWKEAVLCHCKAFIYLKRQMQLNQLCFLILPGLPKRLKSLILCFLTLGGKNRYSDLLRNNFKYDKLWLFLFELRKLQ